MSASPLTEGIIGAPVSGASVPVGLGACQGKGALAKPGSVATGEAEGTGFSPSSGRIQLGPTGPSGGLEVGCAIGAVVVGGTVVADITDGASGVGVEIAASGTVGVSGSAVGGAEIASTGFVGSCVSWSKGVPLVTQGGFSIDSTVGTGSGEVDAVGCVGVGSVIVGGAGVSGILGVVGGTSGVGIGSGIEVGGVSGTDGVGVGILGSAIGGVGIAGSVGLVGDCGSGDPGGLPVDGDVGWVVSSGIK